MWIEDDQDHHDANQCQAGLEQRRHSVGDEQLDQAAQLAPAAGRLLETASELGEAHSRLTSDASTGLRVRNTWSGMPFSTISRYSSERSSSSSWLPRAAIRPASSTTMSSAS